MVHRTGRFFFFIRTAITLPGGDDGYRQLLPLIQITLAYNLRTMTTETGINPTHEDPIA